MRNVFSQMGIALPDQVNLVAAGIAMLVLATVGGIAWAAGRWIGPRLADLWAKHAGSRVEGVGRRMCTLARSLVVWLLLAIVLRAYPWPLLAAVLLGLGAATAAAILIVNLVRGLHMPRWAAALLGTVIFVGVLADAMGGLAAIRGTLSGIGLTLGTRRLTLLGVIQIAVALLALFAVARLVNRVVGHSIKRAPGWDATQKLLAQKLAGVVIIAAVFFIGIDLVGIDLTALAVFSGAVGLAVGFGLQKTVGNLFAGIILLMDRSVKPGDVIAVGDTFGQVTKIGVRAVSVVTRDAKEHLIPNEDLMTREVENWSYSSRNVRVHIPVGVSYDGDLALAQRLMIEAAGASPRVLQSPKPVVWLRGFGDSSVDHEILVWISDPEAGVGNVQSEILNRLWDLFKENDVEIPFPQRDIHIKSLPPGPVPAGLSHGSGEQLV